MHTDSKMIEKTSFNSRLTNYLASNVQRIDYLQQVFMFLMIKSYDYDHD